MRNLYGTKLSESEPLETVRIPMTIDSLPWQVQRTPQ